MSDRLMKIPLKPSAALMAGALVAAMSMTGTVLADDRLQAAVAAEERAEESARDQFRNPYETLLFFGIEPDMTVVELAPSGGWYTEILGPYLAEQGQLVAAHFNLEREDAPEFYVRARQAYEERIADQDRFGSIEILPFDPPTLASLGESGSADMVLTFRSVHGWKRDGVFEDVVNAAHDVLKPGGVFGVVSHRLPEDADDSVFNGYVKQSWVVAQAESNGFKLAEASEINANPNDTADHENGVWTLQPSLRAEDEETRARNAEIGESDRFTLKFIKR
ncbi:MAG: methyltransferase [Pseudomonadota bacterium]